MSAPPLRVTVDHEPKEPQEPPLSVALARWTTSVEASRPTPASEPQAIVSGTESVE